MDKFCHSFHFIRLHFIIVWLIKTTHPFWRFRQFHQPTPAIHPLLQLGTREYIMGRGGLYEDIKGLFVWTIRSVIQVIPSWRYLVWYLHDPTDLKTEKPFLLYLRISCIIIRWIQVNSSVRSIVWVTFHRLRVSLSFAYISRN